MSSAELISEGVKRAGRVRKIKDQQSETELRKLQRTIRGAAETDWTTRTLCQRWQK